MSSQTSGWSIVEIAGHPCDVFLPSQPNPHRQAVIYLHGVHLARLNENRVYSDLLERHGLPMISPHTRRSWWTDKICEEFDPRITAERHVRENIVPWVKAEWGSEPPQIALLGTSMGGQGVLRLSFKYPNQFPIAAALAPAIDYQIRYDDPEDETVRLMYPSAESVRQDTATLHVHPLNWPRNLWFSSDPLDDRWHDSAQKLRMKLYSLGIPHDVDLETRAGGHGWDYYNHMAPAALTFIVERLERERLRVV